MCVCVCVCVCVDVQRSSRARSLARSLAQIREDPRGLNRGTRLLPECACTISGGFKCGRKCQQCGTQRIGASRTAVNAAQKAEPEKNSKVPRKKARCRGHYLLCLFFCELRKLCDCEACVYIYIYIYLLLCSAHNTCKRDTHARASLLSLVY